MTLRPSSTLWGSQRAEILGGISGQKKALAYQLDENGYCQVAAGYAEPGPVPVAVRPGLAIEWSEVFAELA